MFILTCKRFFALRNCMNLWHSSKGSCKFQSINSSKSFACLRSSNRTFSSIPSSSINFTCRTNVKVSSFRINVHCLFRTSPPKYIHPALLIVLRPALKLFAVITGRGIRKWWRSLPKDKKQYFINEIKENRRKIGIALSLIVFLSLGYYLSHLEQTPITNRTRFMAFNTKQLEKINEYELEQLMESLGKQILPPTHPASRKVQNVVKRIIAANADIKEFEGKQFGISVIDSSIENAFVLPIGHVFVFSGMLNLCSNDDQLGMVLAHEIAHCILNHGAENLSFTHLLDSFAVIIIAAIWAVIPIDSASVILHWLFQKSMEILFQLPYNRTLEVEADDVGLQLAAKACFDVRESSAFWSKMAFLTKTFGKGPEIEFLSTHPSHESRSEYLDEKMDLALKLRASCACPRLSYADPRHNIAVVSKALEMTRRQFFEQNKKPEIIVFRK